MLQDKIDLVPLLHASDGLDLDFLDDVCGLVDVSFVLADFGKYPRQLCALDLHEDLTLGDGPQRRNELQLGVFVWSFVQIGHGFFDHAFYCLAEDFFFIDHAASK